MISGVGSLCVAPIFSLAWPHVVMIMMIQLLYTTTNNNNNNDNNDNDNNDNHNDNDNNNDNMTPQRAMQQLPAAHDHVI